MVGSVGGGIERLVIRFELSGVVTECGFPGEDGPDRAGTVGLSGRSHFDWQFTVSSDLVPGSALTVSTHLTGSVGLTLAVGSEAYCLYSGVC